MRGGVFREQCLHLATLPPVRRQPQEGGQHLAGLVGYSGGCQRQELAGGKICWETVRAGIMPPTRLIFHSEA